MDESQVKRVAEAELPVWVRRLGLERIKIRVVYGRCGADDHMAECANSLPYNRSTITLDPALHTDADDVRDSVRHELIHVLLSEYELIWQMVRKTADLESPEWKQFKTAWTMAEERAANAIEYVLDGVETWKDEPTDASDEQVGRSRQSGGGAAGSQGVSGQAAPALQPEHGPVAVAAGQPGGRGNLSFRDLRE